ncbi:MAG: PDZ domain-containing protein, partial [Planctomycetes bacterium]|nr:PDZ domain-containing protein [Planctomycetota bacterium]
VMGGSIMEPADGQRARVTGVQPDSPAARAGFRQGDVIDSPPTFGECDVALEAVRRGETRRFMVRRGADTVEIEAARTKPELAAIWYAGVWYPIAGALFCGMGLLVFATAPIVPAPWTRSVIVMLAGFSIAVGFGVALASGSVFTRFRVYQRWPMGVGDEWSLSQGWIGVVAGLLLSWFAAAELRQRLSGRYQVLHDLTGQAGT